MTHKTELLAWFRRGLSITPAEAVDQWRNYRLADTVYQLRRDGHQINTQTMERTNENGRRVTWARYSYICGPGKETYDPRPLPASPDCSAPKPKDDLMHKVWRAIFGD